MVFLNVRRIIKLGVFFVINALVYFGVYLLIEINARYYYNPQIAVIILGGLGLDRVICFCKTIANESKTFSCLVDKIL